MKRKAPPRTTPAKLRHSPSHIKGLIIGPNRLAGYLCLSRDQCKRLVQWFPLPKPLWCNGKSFWYLSEIYCWIELFPAFIMEVIDRQRDGCLPDAVGLCGELLDSDALETYLKVPCDTLFTLPLPSPIVSNDGTPFWSLASIQKWLLEGPRLNPDPECCCSNCRFWFPDTPTSNDTPIPTSGQCRERRMKKHRRRNLTLRLTNEADQCGGYEPKKQEEPV